MNVSIEVLEDADYYANSLYLKIVSEPFFVLLLEIFQMIAVRISFASMAFIFLTALHMNRKYSSQWS